MKRRMVEKEEKKRKKKKQYGGEGYKLAHLRTNYILRLGDSLHVSANLLLEFNLVDTDLHAARTLQKKERKSVGLWGWRLTFW